jgi:spindle assembly abnormal protein 6
MHARDLCTIPCDRMQGSPMAKTYIVQVLVIQIWNEQDLSSLHTLEVKEDDFQALKVEQGILVDFGGFPAKIIALLQRCLASCHDNPPR